MANKKKRWRIMNCFNSTIDSTTDFNAYCGERGLDFNTIRKNYANQMAIYRHQYIIWNEPMVHTKSTQTDTNQHITNIKKMLVERKQNTIRFDDCQLALTDFKSNLYFNANHGTTS